MRLARLRLRHRDRDAPHSAELLDRRIGVVERLAVPAVLVLDRLDTLALDRARDDHRRPALRLLGLRVRALDLLDVVTVDLDRVPAEGPRALDVHLGVPADHRLAALAEPVDVDDRGQVVELVVRRVLEGLPHRALRHLTVAAQHPDAGGQAVELLCSEAHAHADWQTLSERAGRHIHPGDERRWMSFEDAAELAVREQLLVVDHAGRAKDRVEERRGVPLREDQAVVGRVLRVVEVVAEMARDEHSHQVGCGHPRGRVPRLRCGRGADRVDAELLAEFAELSGVHRVHSRSRAQGSAPREGLCRWDTVQS